MQNIHSRELWNNAHACISRCGEGSGSILSQIGWCVMILYHGLNIANEKINLDLSKPNNDFGKGFTFQYFFGTEDAINLLKKI